MLVFVMALWLSLDIRRELISGDSLPYRYLPEAIIEGHTFRLDRFSELATAPNNYAVIRDGGGHLVSKKPIAPVLAMLPVHIAYKFLIGPPRTDTERAVIGKLSMSIIGAATAAVLVLLVSSFAGAWWGLAAGLGLYALTPFWFVTLDAWPHPVLALCNVLSLFAVWRRPTCRASWAAVGFLQAFAIASRVGALPVTVAFIVYGLTVQPEGRLRRMGFALLGAAAPLLLLFLYNAMMFGSPFTSGFRGQYQNRLALPLEGIAGLLFSPAKGLLLYAPVLTLAFAIPRAVWREPLAKLCLGAFIVHLIFWSCYADWWGGHGFGPRYLSEVIPFLIVLVVMNLRHWSVTPKRGVAMATVVILALWSLAVQKIAWRSWDGVYHGRFDPSWEQGGSWTWSAPYEPAWRLGRDKWYADRPVKPLRGDSSSP